MSGHDDTEDDLRGLRLVAHPLRLRLLSLLTGRTLSAAEAARELGESQANVSYHLRRLAQGGLLVLVEEQSVRGGVAKRYTHDTRSGERLDSADRDGLGHLVRALAHRAGTRAASYREGTRFAFTDAEVRLRPEDWDRVRAHARELGRLVHDLAEDAGADADAVRVSVTVAAFETED